MRRFEDADGRTWVASVRERPGPDYKGRFYFFMVPEGGVETDGLSLLDIRWNTERTARRTLETMSDVELRRRLRQGVGRHPGAVPEASRSASPSEEASGE